MRAPREQTAEAPLYRVEIFFTASRRWEWAGVYHNHADAERRAEEIRLAGYSARVTKVAP